MEEHIKVSGRPIKCMEKEYLSGPTEKSMMGSIFMIKRKVLVFLHGTMVVVMRVTGKMGNSMEKEKSLIKMVINLRGSGTKARESNNRTNEI